MSTHEWAVDQGCGHSHGWMGPHDMHAWIRVVAIHISGVGGTRVVGDIILGLLGVLLVEG